MTFLSELIIFLLSSLVSLTFSYLRISITVLQQVVTVLIVILIVVINKVALSHAKHISSVTRLMLLFLVSLFPQLLVFYTGGFKSPFLITFHLFAIGASFLLSLRTGVLFLIFAVPNLILSMGLDPRLQSIYQDDPWTIILYTFSFIAVLPLYQLLVSRYNLEDKILRILAKQIKLGKIREQSILESLSDLVIVTDVKFNILSCNEAVEKALRLSSSKIIKRPLFDVISLKDADGNMMNLQSVLINRVLTDKAVRIYENLFLHVKDTGMRKKVNVHVNPTINLEGVIDQIVFVITEKQTEGGGNSSSPVTAYTL